MNLSEETTLVLAAVLLRFGKPIPAHSVRVAFAKAYPGNARADGVCWGDAVRHLRGTGRLVEGLDEGTWAPGPAERFKNLYLEGWPEQEADKIIALLPENLVKEFPVPRSS